MPIPNDPRAWDIDCQWLCHCGSQMAFVGRFLTEVRCRNCKRWYLVTENGVMDVTERNYEVETISKRLADNEVSKLPIPTLDS